MYVSISLILTFFEGKIISFVIIFLLQKLVFSPIDIKELSLLIAKFIKFKGTIKFDKKSPDGTFRKGLDSEKINQLGWYPKIGLADGLKKVIEKRL